MQSIDIVEQVIRIQPQVIVCSDFLRTRQTAHAVKDIMKTHLSKEVEVIETPEWGLDATSETIGNLYTNLLERYE